MPRPIGRRVYCIKQSNYVPTVIPGFTGRNYRIAGKVTLEDFCQQGTNVTFRRLNEFNYLAGYFV